MSCDEVFEALASGRIDESKRAAVEAHLATCEECRTMQEGLRAFDQAQLQPGEFGGDPPHVKEAILRRAHEKAAEFRAKNASIGMPGV